jgi:hypothetical protein
MTRLFRRRVATIAMAAIPLAALTVATSPVSSAQCDLTQLHCAGQCDPNWSRNVWTNECKPPPPAPAWWTPRPDYAPPNAPLDVPPPPPPPPWAQQMQPRWDEGGQHWVWSGI